MRAEGVSGRNSRLALVFLGWGMDGSVLPTVEMRGYDIACMSDYTVEDEIAGVEEYDEIVVVAWSFGVPAAARWIASHPRLPVTARVAVAGTPWPVDNELGIPRDIFAGTLEGLDERRFAKFVRRCCADSATASRLLGALEPRDIDSLRRELMAIDSRGCEPTVMFDTAYVCADDRIIPPDNQRRVWSRRAWRTVELESPHLPPLDQVLRLTLHDKRLIGDMFGGSAATYDAQAQVQRDAAMRLVEGLAQRRQGTTNHIVEVGCGTGICTRMLAERFHPEELTLNDLYSPDVAVEAPATRFVAGDGEQLMLSMADASADMVVAASAAQWFNSLPGFVREARRVLRPGGLLGLTLYGPQTMAELDPRLGSRNGFFSVAELRAMMPGATVESRVQTLRFDDMRQLARHLRETGVNGHARADVGALREFVAKTAAPALTYEVIEVICPK